MSGPYFIYASNSGKTPEGNTQILDKGSDIDTFIGSLPDKGIVLKSQPSLSADCDSSDAWAKWMTSVDAKAEISLTWSDLTSKTIQKFQVKLASIVNDVDLIFDSSDACLSNSFGLTVPGNLPKIRPPGINQDHDTLCCGLSDMSPVKGTVKSLLDYAGANGNSPTLPSSLLSASVSLDPHDASNERNAVWIRPSLDFQTTIRLSFKLDVHTDLEALLIPSLPGLSLPTVSIVCKKVATQGVTAQGTIPVVTGSLVFYATGSIAPNAHPQVDVAAAVEFGGSQMSLTFLLKELDALDKILEWLGSLTDLAVRDTVSNLLGKDSIFSHFNLRRIRIALSNAEPNKLSISSFSIDIEVLADFGKQKDKSNSKVAFLLSYTYITAIGGSGMLTGQFWPSMDPTDDTTPDYEPWSELLPSDNAVERSISLETLIPNQPITNIPSTIPSKITTARLDISSNNFRFLARVESIEPTPGSVPLPYLGEVVIDVSYAWGKASDFALDVYVSAGLLPSQASQDQTAATLSGQIHYSSGLESSWQLKAQLQGLHASSLCHFLGPDSADQVASMIDSIEIESLEVSYEYTKPANGSCSIRGVLVVGELQLVLDFEYQDGWTLTATLATNTDSSTLGSVISSIVGDDITDLPDFVYQLAIDKNDTLKIEISGKGSKPPAGTDSTVVKAGSDSGQGVISGANTGVGTPSAATPFIFAASFSIDALSLDFVQYRNGDWAPQVPSKRIFKVALHQLPSVKVPLIGDITQPFDEMYYLWVQDGTDKNQEKVAGLTRTEEELISTKMQLVLKDNFKDKSPDDVLLTAGSHFAIVVKGTDGKPTCILDYDFKAPQNTSKQTEAVTTAEVAKSDAAAAPHDGVTDRASEPAPLKKDLGPLSIRNLSVKYKDKILYITLDASLVLGPLMFDLLGFSIDFTITALDKPEQWELGFGLEGLSVAFEKAPLTIAGIIRHGKTNDMEYYAGGLIVGFVPYQFMAAGFYGQVTPKDKTEAFKSVFVFAKLNGPLITFEFATISGVTGGIGYNSQVRAPKVAEVLQFPFVAPNALEGGTGSPLDALQKLVSPETGGWFSPKNDSYWAAAGMKVDAFQMLSIDAVVVVEFATSIKIGIYAVATADLPAKADTKLAHVELGIAITIDFDYGVFRAEGSLSPTSYILHKDCHLTGGFGFCYWFDAPHADPSSVGQFVFTIGGYHQAFKPPAIYPVPPRLGISWKLGENLSITGEAYFAITPKVCMGGGRLHAAYSAGPIEAWFDAYADFLINFKPFHFIAEAGIAVGVRFNLDLLFIHTHISVEISATLTLWGPPVAGRVHVDLWVHAFDINFGNGQEKAQPVDLQDFFDLVQQNNQQTEGNNAHNFLAVAGLRNGDDKPEKGADVLWSVRAGTLSFNINCTMAIDTAISGKGNLDTLDTTKYPSIYARPMHLQSPLKSVLTIETYNEKNEIMDIAWRLDRFMKPMPAGLWGFYNPKDDPSGGNNHVADLLNTSSTGIPLMAGVNLKSPPPRLSPDKLPPYHVEDAEIQNIQADKPFPKQEDAHKEFLPVDPLEGTAQYDAILKAWTEPAYSTTKPGSTADFVSKWATALLWDAETLKKISSIPPVLKKQFNNLYIAAPLLTA